MNQVINQPEHDQAVVPDFDDGLGEPNRLRYDGDRLPEAQEILRGIAEELEVGNNQSLPIGVIAALQVHADAVNSGQLATRRREIVSTMLPEAYNTAEIAAYIGTLLRELVVATDEISGDLAIAELEALNIWADRPGS